MQHTTQIGLTAGKLSQAESAQANPARTERVGLLVSWARASLVGAAIVGAVLGGNLTAAALMRQGDEGAGVRRLQRELGVSPTGYYGSATRAAVAAFQAENGLLVDGIAGPETLAALGLPSGLSADEAAAADGDEAATVATAVVQQRVRVYAEPSLRSPVRYVLYDRDRVSLTGQTAFREGYRWQQLAGGGWVLSDGSEVIGGIGGDTDEVVDVGARAFVTASALLVRAAPAGTVVGELGYGTPLALTGARRLVDGLFWVQLASGAWVAEDYIAYR